MNTQEVVTKAREHFTQMGKTSSDGITSLSRTDDGWAVSAEIVERKAIPDTMDVLGMYEIRLDDQGNLLSFQRMKLRKRGETQER